jgi:hypothetical protein
MDETATAAPDAPQAPEMWRRDRVCQFFGGDRPIDRVTLLRWVKAGRVPAPTKVTPRLHLWKAEECRAAMQRMIAARGA